jgi:hypothetical protein
MKVKKKQIFHDRTNGYKERTRARMRALVIFKRLTKNANKDLITTILLLTSLYFAF